MDPSGPNAVYRFTLSQADGLAWELLPRELTRAQKLSFVVTLATAALAVALLPAEWRQGWVFWLWLIWAALAAYTIATVMQRSAARRRAAARFPKPVELVVEVSDHAFMIHEGLRERSMAFEAIVTTARSTTHLFFETERDLLIMPQAAFPPGAASALVTRVRLAGLRPSRLPRWQRHGAGG